MAFLFTLGSCLQDEGKRGLQIVSYSIPKDIVRGYSSWLHVCHIILKVLFFFIVMFSYICCNLLSSFFILVIFHKPPRQKKRHKMIIFMTGITIRLYSDQGNRSTIILKNP